MRKGDVNRFFREAAKEIRTPVKVYITGGVASWLMGGNRPTEDIDFGIKTKGKQSGRIGEIFGEVSERLGIAIQFSENISRWGMIDLPDYEKKAKLYKRFGKLSVYFLDIGSWSIGKLSRYYASDLSDLVAVFKSQKPIPAKLVLLWAEAVKRSPRSSDQFLFIKNVEDFIKNEGPKIWGQHFELVKMIKLFHNRVNT